MNDERFSMNDEREHKAHDIFLRYFSRERHRIFQFIFSVLPNEADAEDVFQQASIILWKNFHDFDQSREFYPWACGVALRAVQNFRRAAKRRNLVLNDELVSLIAQEQISSSPRSAYRVELLQECVALLPPRDHKIVKQIYYDCASAGNVAENMGRSVQTIYNRLNVIRKELLNCVNRKGGDAAAST